jgi:hypothetical protein
MIFLILLSHLNNTGKGNAMRQSPIKSGLIVFIQDIAKELADSQKSLQEHITEQRACTAFGETAFRDLQLAESASHALNFTIEFVKGEEFAKLTEEEVAEIIQNHINDKHRREVNFFKNGINPRDVIYASGVMQVKIGLEKVLKKTL